jgi:hypothetical protein
VFNPGTQDVGQQIDAPLWANQQQPITHFLCVLCVFRGSKPVCNGRSRANFTPTTMLPRHVILPHRNVSHPHCQVVRIMFRLGDVHEKKFEPGLCFLLFDKLLRRSRWCSSVSQNKTCFHGVAL